MPELLNRRRHEASVTGAAFLLLLKQRPRIAEGHFNQRDFIRDFRDSLTPRLQKIYESSFRALTKIYGVRHDAEELSKRFATDLSQKLAKEIAGNVAEDISAAAKRAAHEERNRAEILQDLAERFGKARAKSIGITETTRAATAGERDAVRIIRQQTGVVLTARWYTSRMANVCDICSPLHDTPQAIWRRRFPLGPPAHPRCNCFLDYATN